MSNIFLLSQLSKYNRSIKHLFITGQIFFILICSFPHTAESFGLDPAGRSGDKPFQFQEEPALPIPPVRLRPVLPPLPKKESENFPTIEVFVREIKITGSSVFFDQELGRVTEPYVNRKLSAEDLEELRRALIFYYINRGYINSGAVFPDQTVVDGVITIKIIEGELTGIEVAGLKWFRATYIKNRIATGCGTPLNIKSLQEQLQILQQDPLIERINAELGPGLEPGKSLLNIKVKEKTPYQIQMRFNNYQSPSVGGERGQIFMAHRNLTGNGDILNAAYSLSDGVDPQIESRYSFPVIKLDTILSLEYRLNDYIVVEQPFDSLDIDGKSEIFGIKLKRSIYRSLNQKLSLTLAGERLKNKTYLLGMPFSFSSGAENGKSTVTAIRLIPEWIYQTQSQAIAVRTSLSKGLNALGATIHHGEGNIPDSDFLAWLIQLQLVRRLDFLDIQVIFRGDLQLTDAPLLPLEQIAVGGIYSVRGYRENLMVRDNGLITSLELRLPLMHDKPWADFIQLVLFADYGRAWNKEDSDCDFKDITSTGIGFRWARTLSPPFYVKPNFEIYWGIPFRDINPDNRNIQDSGIHFQFTLEACRH